MAKKLSIVSTLYMSQDYIHDFCKRCKDTAQSIVGNNYEIILVNDGSPDKSLDVALEATSYCDNLTVLNLSRNFGHHAAMMAGLSKASGDLVFLIDSDLEEAPEWLSAFLHEWNQTNADVVYGVQSNRKGNLLEKISGAIFWFFFIRLSGINMPANQTTARLMSRQYVDALLLYKERELFLGAVWHLAGFTQLPLKVNKLSISISTYTFRKKAKIFLESLTSFSNRPLYYIFYLGFALTTVSTFGIVYLLIRWLFSDSGTPPGWISVLVSIWLLGGITIAFLGLIGIYIAKIYMETKQRPSTIIKEIYSSTKQISTNTAGISSTPRASDCIK